MNDAARKAVLAEFHTWEGTPFRDSARIKGYRGGVDCGQLLCAVFEAAGIAPHIETPKYNLQFMLNRSEEWYLELMQTYGIEIAAAETAPGDVVLFRQGRIYSHAGILIDPWCGRIGHALNGLGVGIADASRDGRIQAAMQKYRAYPPLFFTPKERM